MWLDYVDLDPLKQHWNWAEVESQNPQYINLMVIGMQTIELVFGKSYGIISIAADRFYLSTIGKSNVYFGGAVGVEIGFESMSSNKTGAL